MNRHWITPPQRPESGASAGFFVRRLVGVCGGAAWFLGGTILVLAALLKWHAAWYLSGLYPYAPVIEHPLVQLPVAVVEWSLGWVLLARLGGTRTQRAATVFFLLLALVAAWQWARGSNSCGCWGEWVVHPRSMVLTDLVLALWLMSAPAPAGFSRREELGRMVAGMIGLALLGAVPAVVISGNTVSRGAPGLRSNEAGTVALEPDQWLGHRLPLIDDLPKDWEMETGRWRILFYFPQCKNCPGLFHRMLKQPRWTQPEPGVRVALVEFPPFSGEKSLLRQHLEHARYAAMPADRHWLSPTPIWVELEGGRVTQVATGDQVLGP